MKSHKQKLMLLDWLQLLAVELMMLVVYPNHIYEMDAAGVVLQMVLSSAVLFGVRWFGGLYRYVWRYAGSREYIILTLADACAGAVYYVLQWVLPMQKITFIRAAVMLCINLLATISLRMGYQYLYEARSQGSAIAGIFRKVTALVTGIKA